MFFSHEKTEEEIKMLSTKGKEQYTTFKISYKKECLVHKRGFYSWKKTYGVVEGQLERGTSVKSHVRINEDNNTSECWLVVPMSMLNVLDIIHQSHCISHSHMGEKRAFADLSKNIVPIFIKPVCITTKSSRSSKH